MEIIQALAAFFVFFAVASAIVQLIFCYSLQVLAEKNDLPDFTAFLAWIPLLNLYPYVKVGGGSFKAFLLGAVGSVVGLGLIAGGAAAAGYGGIGSAVAAVAFALLAVVYLARIAMGTAERRGLSRWLGLLSFVPLANIVAYPYFAFHDGFRAPNKAGLLLGLLLAFGPLPGQIAMVNALTAQAQEAAQSDLGNGATLQQAMGGLGAAMQIGAQLSAIEQMDPSDPEQAARMNESIATVRDRLAQDRAAIGEEVAVEMDRMLQEQETRLQASGTASDSPQAVVAASTRPAKPAPRRAAPPAPPSPPLTASIQRHGDDGFAVPAAPACPPGTELRGAAPPTGTREWCERVGVDAGIKHGWMTEYHDNGNPAVAGEYRDGLRVGVWTRYYEDGTKRAQAEFEDGLQHGVLISWGPDGSKIYEQYFEGGAPASR